MNNRGQFSIIAALLVAVVLVAAVATTYSAMKFSVSEDQPQILSVIDETNLGLKEILGFTVGYYGSVLKVTGNQTYALMLATNYLGSGLENVGDIHPEWNMNFNLTDLVLDASWFSGQSYSKGNMTINYDLAGLGIYGVSYSSTVRLDVKILEGSLSNQTQLVILRDEADPLINLGKSNLKFYQYNYQTSTWNHSEPLNIASYANGTYVLDLPSGVTNNAYTIEVSDTRGLMVLASSFNKFTTQLSWNSTGFRQGFLDYVDQKTDVIGTHSNFAAQQSGPDSTYDTLTEHPIGTVAVNNYPSTWTPIGSTSIVSGDIADLQSDNEAYFRLRSYLSYSTITLDRHNSYSNSSTSSISWQHTTGVGNDKVLLVSVDVSRTASTSAPTTVSNVTYGSQSLTSVATAAYISSTNPQVRSYVFILTNPSEGTNTVTVNFAANTSAIGGSITYCNVNQTNPILASNTANGYGSSQTVSLSATGSHSKVLFGHVGTYRTQSGYSLNEGWGQVRRWGQTDQNYKGVGSDKTVTSGGVSTSWTTTSSAAWVAISTLLRPTCSYVCGAEFTGASNLETWNNIAWTIDALASTSNVAVEYQLYNFQTMQYMTAGNGYLTDTLGTTDRIKTQTIDTNLGDYRDSLGNWKIRVNSTKSSVFDLRLDLVKYSINQTNYVLNIEEQWIDVNSTNVRQDLCVKTGSSTTAESIIVQIWQGGSWLNLMTLIPNHFNNASLAPYISSSQLKIRFIGNNEDVDSTGSTWNIDCAYIKDQPDIAFLINRQQSMFTIELLQNGTMCWLGQNLQTTTQTLPIPPISIKSIHVNQTINGVNQEVPFQIEDWASNYQIPLGLTNNATVFSNRQMIVLLVDIKVSDFTIWWDGKHNTTQTPMAFTNRFFTGDNLNSATLTNSNITLQFSGGTVTSTVVGSSTSSTATFMRVNQEASTYGSGSSYVIHHGVVRDVVMQEAEWNTGAVNCPNFYANFVITLPANANYYTYQQRFMFISSSQARTITDMCPISLTTSLISGQTQTENDKLAGFPIIANGTAAYSNTDIDSWTPHHFSQFIQDGGRGTGIMYTDIQNQRLYSFDIIAGASTGTLYANSASRLIELLPVDLAQVQFTYAYDFILKGAVATFHSTTPICSLYDATTPMGLWILAEYPPIITITPYS
jgi:hypothetical protein